MKKLITLSMLVLFTGLMFNARADYTIESLGFEYIYAYEQMGQSFTTIGAGNITDITVYNYDAGVIDTDLRIFNGESVAPGDEIYTEAVTFSGQGAHTFTLATPVAVNAATVYTFAFDYAYLVFSVDIYAGGNAFIPSLGDFCAYDLYFIVAIQTAGPNPGEWTGAIDSDWATAGNWDDGNVPTGAVDVTIPGGLTNYPVVDEAGDVCNNLAVNDGGLLTVISGGALAVGGSMSVGAGTSGEFQMDDGTCTVTGGYYTEIGSTTDINGGIFGFTDWYRNAGNVWSKGIRELSGGTINASEDIIWSSFDVSGEMTGTFTANIGGAFRADGALFTTITGGTFIMNGSSNPGGTFGCVCGAWGTGNYLSVYNLTFNDGGAGNTFTFAYDDAAMRSGIQIVNDFNVISGSVITYSGAGYAENFSVGGDFTVAPGSDVSSDANTPISVTGDFTLQSNPTTYSSWIDDNNLSVAKGILSVQSDRTGPSWHFISPPVSGATAAMFTGLYLQYHTESTNTYTDIIPTTTPLNVMQGYALYGSGKAIYNAATLNSGNQSTNLTRAFDGVTRGWNLVGNPYPSAIDWNAGTGWTKTNVNGSTWIEAAGSWAIWNGTTGTNGATQYIAPAQGFFVEVADGNTTGTLGVTKDVRTHQKPTFFKDAIAGILKLQAEGNGLTDETVIWFNEDATEGYDGQYDAHKLWATDDYPQFYSLANDNMAINVLPAVDFVPMGFKAGVTGDYIISTVEDGEFNDVVLEDLLLNTQTDLLNNSYTFTYNTGENEARFIVHFTPLAVPDGNAAELFNIYSYYNNIYVAVPENTKGNIVVYDVMGQEVANAPINSVLNTIILEKSAYYIVKVLSDESVVTKKVFIK